MYIRPLHDQVVIKPLDEELPLFEGIEMPETTKEKSMHGAVVAVGDGTLLSNGKIKSLDVDVGDLVLINKTCGTKTKLDGEELLVCKETEVMAVIE